MLRHYDSIGLVRPTGRTVAGYREYSSDDIRRIFHIESLRSLGLSLKEAGRALDDPTFDPAALVGDLIARTRERIADQTRLLTRLQQIGVVTAAGWEDVLQIVALLQALGSDNAGRRQQAALSAVDEIPMPVEVLVAAVLNESDPHVAGALRWALVQAVVPSGSPRETGPVAGDESHPEAESRTPAGADSNARPDDSAEAWAEAEGGTCSRAWPGADPRPGAAARAGFRAGAEAEVKTGAAVKAEAGSGLRAEVETAVTAGAENGMRAEARTGMTAEASAGMRAEVETAVTAGVQDVLALLAAGLRSPSSAVRRRAVETIAEFPTDEATARLQEALTHSDELVRRRAAVALGARGAAGAVPTLVGMIVADTGEANAADALCALASGSADPALADRIAAVLAGRIAEIKARNTRRPGDDVPDGGHAAARQRLTQALADIPGRTATRALAELTDDDDRAVALTAAYVLTLRDGGPDGSRDTGSRTDREVT